MDVRVIGDGSDALLPLTGLAALYILHDAFFPSNDYDSSRFRMAKRTTLSTFAIEKMANQSSRYFGLQLTNQRRARILSGIVQYQFSYPRTSNHHDSWFHWVDGHSAGTDIDQLTGCVSNHKPRSMTILDTLHAVPRLWISFFSTHFSGCIHASFKSSGTRPSSNLTN